MANTIFYVYNNNTAWVDAYSTSTNSTIRINWGDGNTETVNLTTSVTSTDHTYSTTNDYAVEIEVTSGTIGIGGGTNVAFGALAAGDVIIGDSVTEIGTGSFVSCSTTKLTIGKDVTSIKENSFNDNQSLTEIKFTSTTPPDLDPSGNNQSAFNHSYIETIKVPLSALSTYQTAYNGYTISIYDTEQEDFVDTLMTSLMETYDDIPRYLDKTGTQLLINEIKRRLGLKQDVVQYSLMPAASADNLGKIYQYVGTTTSSYTQGYFYQCVSDGAASPTYSWEPIAASGDGVHFRGSTTTTLKDGATTNPIIIDGSSYTAVMGDMVIYSNGEFLFDGTVWHEMGSVGRQYYFSGVSNGEIFNAYSGVFANKASGIRSHAEGSGTTASGDESHAEGDRTKASGSSSHAEGNQTTASGNHSHAEGQGTTASGKESHAEGVGTVASEQASHVSGKYNDFKTGDLFEIGNGTSKNARSNIVEVSSTYLNVNGAIKANGVAYSTPYTTMPTVTAAMVGQIAQYMGVTNSTYTRGWFYEAVSDGAASPTYSWEPIDASGEDTSHFIGTTTEWTNVQDKSAYDGGIVVFTDDNDTVVGSLATTVTHGDLRAVTSDGVASALSEIVRPVAYRAYSNAGQTPLGLFARQYYDGRLIFHYRAGIRISNATPAVISFPASDDYDFYVNGSNPLEMAPDSKNTGFKNAWDQYVSTQNNIASACVIFTPKSSSDPAYVSGDTTAESDITAVATVNRMQKNQDGTYSIYCAVQGNYIGPAYVDVLFDSF